MDRNSLKTILEGNHSNINELYAIDGDLLIAVSLAKIKKSTIYLWGIIYSIDYVIDTLKSYGLNVAGIIDSNIEQIRDQINGVPIISPESFVNIQETNAYVFILTRFCSGIRNQLFLKTLNEAGCKDYYIFDDYDKERLTSITVGWMDGNRKSYYKNHEEELLRLFDELEDEESRETLVEYIKTYVCNQRYSRKHLKTIDKYFFVDDGKSKYSHLNDEVWLNCGASVGDTIFAYFSNGLTAKKVVAYEGETDVYNRLKDNIGLLPEEIRNRIILKKEFIDDNTDFSFIEDKVTLVNADIEGAELGLLKSLEEIIKKDRPVLSICVYHLKEDLIEIPAYIKTLMPSCALYLRKYTPWLKNHNLNHELVLYAVPNERKNSE